MTPTLALTDAITCLGMEWAERVREAADTTTRTRPTRAADQEDDRG